MHKSSDLIGCKSGKPSISVIIPVYRNRETISSLASRADAVLEDSSRSHEIIFVDDASPDDSWAVIRELAAANPHVRGLRHTRNLSQHEAVLTGLAHASGDVSVTMDADLQDPPEAIPSLLDALRCSDADVVFAGRIGNYQSWYRMITSRLYRALLLGWLTRLPSDAGMFFAIRRSALARVLALRSPGQASVIGMIAAAQLRSGSVPVPRARRRHGYSAYTTGCRVRSALHMVRCTLFAKPASHGPIQGTDAGAKIDSSCNLTGGESR